MLGAILIDNEAFNTAIAIITANAFFRDAHRRIFERMTDLVERRSAIDFVTLREELARSGELEDVGGPAYLASLVDGVPRSTNVEYYARIVKEKATLRSLIYAANKIVANAYEADQDADLILDDAESAIFSVAEDRIKAGFVPMRQLVQESFPKIEKLFEHQSFVTGVGTHLPDLDRLTRGFQPGDLVIVAARPSMGKTSLVLNVCQHVATQPMPGANRFGVAGVFSLEMSKEQLFMRMLASEAKIDSFRLLSGQIGQREYGQITHAMETLSEAQLYVDDSAGVGVLEMRAKARRLQAEHGLDILAVDYVQLMTGRGRFENRTLELASISRSLKGLAKELNVPIIVLSQLSRAPEARSDKRPMLSDLRESGALEQDADVVIMIFREEMYKADRSVPAETDGIAELIIAKQRNGPTGTVKTAFIAGQTKFMPLAPRHVIRCTSARVDLAAVQANYRAIAAYLTRDAEINRARPERPTAPGILPVVKANAYGHGAVPVARALRDAGAAWLAVADLEEGLELRDAGDRGRILVFGALSVSDVEGVFTHDLTPTVSSPGAARALAAAARARGVRLACHLKIDTGLNRLGFRHDNLGRTLPPVLGDPALDVEGLFTHFATADDPEHALFETQRARFDEARATVARLGARPRLIHAANSAACLRDSRTWGDLVRPGLLLYGLVPPPLASTLPLVPAMTLSSRVVAVKGVRLG